MRSTCLKVPFDRRCLLLLSPDSDPISRRFRKVKGICEIAVRRCELIRQFEREAGFGHIGSTTLDIPLDPR